MTELKPLPVSEVTEMLTPEDLETLGIGEESTISMAELLLALAIDSCDSIKNHASTVFEGKDGRLLVITGQYTDGTPLTLKYAEAVSQRNALYKMLDKLRSACQVGIHDGDLSGYVDQILLDEAQATLHQVDKDLEKDD